MAAKRIFDEVYPEELHYVVATDRKCGVEDVCRSLNLPHERFNQKSRADLSRAIATYFRKQDADICLMFFLRIVTADLYAVLPTLNLHPSLLPNFKGIGAIERAIAANAETLGCTLHMVDKSVDGGAIVAQVWTGMPAEIARARNFSYCQKVLLSVALFSMLREGKLQFRKDTDGFSTVCTGLSFEDVALVEACNEFLLAEGYPSHRSALQLPSN